MAHITLLTSVKLVSLRFYPWSVSDTLLMLSQMLTAALKLLICSTTQSSVALKTTRIMQKEI